MIDFAFIDPGKVLRIAQVAFGIGLVIFVHELGHFIAARWCGVRVELFSLGFGPRLFGWKRGSTSYQLALIPMGGFVKMAGEEGVPGQPAPDELPAKSVGQRFFIYSGGVLMNVLFALVVFPPLLFYGVPFPEPVVGEVVSGSPAWRAGLRTGTRILEIDGERIVSFEDLAEEIALSSSDEVELLVRGPGAAGERTVHVRPVYDTDRGIRVIGVELPFDPEHKLVVAPDSPAAAAGLRNGDRVVGLDGSSERLFERMSVQMNRGEALSLDIVRSRAARQEGAEPEELSLTLVPAPPVKPPKKAQAKLGIMPAESLVAALRPEGAPSALGLVAGDRILFIEGEVVARRGDFAVAVRAAHDRELSIVVERAGALRTLAVGPLSEEACASAIDAVAVVSDLGHGRVVVPPGSPAGAAGLLTGDRIVDLGGKPVARWPEIFDLIRGTAKPGKPLSVRAVRLAADGRTTEIAVNVLPGNLAEPVYGLALENAIYVFRAESFSEAVRIGVTETGKILADAWHMLSGIFRGRVSGENLGGIIAISQVSYIFAGVGLAKLLFFLCMVSLSLAFINVLPIPVLDGGHLFFLLIEKVKGSPVNERVLGYSQMVGLVLILGLVVFVTFNDLKRILVE